MKIFHPIAFPLLLMAVLLASLPLFSQTEKGFTPTSKKNPISGKTHAVVIGISDYQDVGIPDLNFADRDAEAFADWLKSSAGGNVPDSNIIILTNGMATNARIAASLDWLIEVAGEGDQVAIYFSGHGDVETKTRGQFGFLLAWDSPPSNYKAGAYSIIYLQDIISTLSIDKKARVTVVTDACHAGKLAGSSIGGTQATAQALSQQFANEVKIMSCQPNEFSLEGQQWGNGRGVFSYHLMDGLSGLADENGDGSIALREIGRYLEDEVPAEAAPHQQTPLIVGDRNTLLAKVDAAMLVSVQSKKKSAPLAMAKTGSKGLADGYLANADSATQVIYHAFEAALAAGNLLDGDSSADFFYKKLLGKAELKPLHGLMRRNLAVALQDEVQQALNALLADDPYETNNFLYNPEKYAAYPRYLQRTIELLGEGHYMYRSLRSKQLFFEGNNMVNLVSNYEEDPVRRDSFKMEAKKLFLQSLAMDGEAAYACYGIGRLYQWNSPLESDSVSLWMGRATDITPTWLSPYLEAAYEYSLNIQDYDKAEAWISRALAQDSTSYLVLERLSWLRQWQLRPLESIAISDKMIVLKPDIFNAYSTKARTLSSMLGEYEESIGYCQKALELNPDPSNWANEDLIYAKLYTRQTDEAERLCKQLLSQKLDNDLKGRYSTLLYITLLDLERYDDAQAIRNEVETMTVANVKVEQAMDSYECFMWTRQSELDKAEAVFNKIYSSYPIDYWYYHALGEIRWRQGRFDEAEQLFKQLFAEKMDWLNVFNYNESHRHYGQMFLSQNRDEAAKAQFEECRKIGPKCWQWPFGQALIAAKHGNKTEALDWLEKSLDRYLPYKIYVMDEPLFDKIRKTKRFKELMQKHFPEK